MFAIVKQDYDPSSQDWITISAYNVPTGCLVRTTRSTNPDMYKVLSESTVFVLDVELHRGKGGSFSLEVVPEQ